MPRVKHFFFGFWFFCVIIIPITTFILKRGKTMLEPLKKTRLYEDIINQLLSLIQEGKLKAGDRLPPERQLAEELQVSRTALREALRAMESQGYLESKPGGGTYIRSVTLDNVISPFAVMLSQDDKLIRELVSVRELLESETAYLAAKNYDSKYETRLIEALFHMEQEMDEGHLGLESDNEFHNLIAEIAQNGALSLICELCSELLSQSRLMCLESMDDPRKTLDDHRCVAEAIMEGSCDDAARYMRKHLRNAMENLDKARKKKDSLK